MSSPAINVQRDPMTGSAYFSLRRSEQDLIPAALAQADGNQTRAAALRGIGRFSLRYKMKKLGMLRRNDQLRTPERPQAASTGGIGAVARL